ncbi:MAG: methyltransferase domain-containing protein [Candidatus Paceibacterota bacterium]
MDVELNPTSFRPGIAGTGGFMDPQMIVGYFGAKEGMNIADFGSGAGYFTILLAKIVGDGGVVTAVDIMDSALETLKAKAGAEGLKNLQTVRSNLEAQRGSGLADESQDMVLLANILFQSDNKPAIITEAKRVLKPEGTLVIIDWKKGSLGFGPPDERRTDPRDMQKFATDGGFQLINPIDAGTFHYGMILKKIS